MNSSLLILNSNFIGRIDDSAHESKVRLGLCVPYHKLGSFCESGRSMTVCGVCEGLRVVPRKDARREMRARDLDYVGGDLASERWETTIDRGHEIELEERFLGNNRYRCPGCTASKPDPRRPDM
jgi:hypothetical protein